MDEKKAFANLCEELGKRSNELLEQGTMMREGLEKQFRIATKDICTGTVSFNYIVDVMYAYINCLKDMRMIESKEALKLYKEFSDRAYDILNLGGK